MQSVRILYPRTVETDQDDFQHTIRVLTLLMWAPRNVDELLRFHMKELARLGLYEWGAAPPSSDSTYLLLEGLAVRLCWPLGPDLSTRFYCNDCHSDFPVCLGRSGWPLVDGYHSCAGGTFQVEFAFALWIENISDAKSSPEAAEGRALPSFASPPPQCR
ncbi:hypothetical protein AVEN_202429-1 [Araneus ventricosus]|uniref:Uncharacterized protein n=1 Tax=Araneus ventricosus TaxID=182803 RepID=A0A4Y2PD44_ARAVE|nr:hypothetical protein AVEN_202429-1 [Araneus ventricosus]